MVRRGLDEIYHLLCFISSFSHAIDCFQEQKEEVDQLLFKTKTEMHVTLQPGGRSPKQVNGPTSTSQLKSASDDGQNNGNSFHSQARGKKRERGDHGADPVKRERSS